ncbi:MAG TPA: acyl-CoA carboxylase subunit beta [Microlunatus sp.]|nr:acyl-CoA carboxylase subunit beta [Microlunatus sp.]
MRADHTMPAQLTIAVPPGQPADAAERGRSGSRPQRASMQTRLDELRERRAAVADDDGLGTQRQRRSGKLTVRERIQALLDHDSFHEIESLRRHRAHGFGLEDRRIDTDGVVTGWGRIHGTQVFVYAQDFRILGGSLGEAHAQKIQKVLDLALSVGAPVIGLNDSSGARIQEGVTALAGYGGIFRRNVAASGVIPQISVMLGPCAGGASYSPALTDFVFMVRKTSAMFLTGPSVIKAVTGEVVTQEELGGADVHATSTGLATFVFDDEATCLDEVRYLVSMLPSRTAGPAPWYEPEDDPARAVDRLVDIVPADSRLPYDIRDVITEIVDDHDTVELHQAWAPNVVCVLARLDGHVVGVVGNQPQSLAGVLNIEASEKAARFVRMCDAFRIPLVTLVDVPGFLPGTEQEHGGAIRHGAKLLYAYCEASVPRIQLILRKAYGGAYIVMDSRPIGADLAFAWPTNEVAVMGAEGAVDVIHRRKIAAADDPAELRDQLAGQYAAELMHPFYAAERGLIDEVIEPRDTRRVLIASLAMLADKQRPAGYQRHGNPPL